MLVDVAVIDRSATSRFVVRAEVGRDIVLLVEQELVAGEWVEIGTIRMSVADVEKIKRTIGERLPS